jgi:hypothetical protein
MAKRDHTDTVRDVLTGQGLNTPDGQIYASPLHEGMEDDIVWMVQTGGPAPQDQFGNTESIQHPTIQVRVRNDDVPTGKSDADDIWQLLHDTTPAGYSRTNMVQSGPIYLGADGDGRHDWSINAELFISE